MATTKQLTARLCLLADEGCVLSTPDRLTLFAAASRLGELEGRNNVLIDICRLGPLELAAKYGDGFDPAEWLDKAEPAQEPLP